MDVEKRFQLVSSVGEEIVTPGELKELLRTKKHPVAYDGFEPSGLAPVHFGVYRALNLKDLLKAGIKFKLPTSFNAIPRSKQRLIDTVIDNVNPFG